MTGESKSSVHNAVSRGEKIAPDVLNDIRGTQMEKGVELDALKGFSHDEWRHNYSALRAISWRLRALARLLNFCEDARPTRDSYIVACPW